YGFSGGAQFPLPPVIYFDNPAAGSHTYALQVQVTTTAGNVVFQADSPGMVHVLELACWDGPHEPRGSRGEDRATSRGTGAPARAACRAAPRGPRDTRQVCSA